MQGPAKIATYLGVIMALLGFVLIGLAWNFAAELDFIQGQFPYFLSGGLGGLGLIIGGMAVLAIQTQRTITAKRAQEMGRLQSEADALIRNVIKPAEGEIIEDETIVDVGARTVVRTIDRRPLDEAEADRQLTGQTGPTGDRSGRFAPKPRSQRSPTGEGEPAEDPTSVALLEREQDGDRAWAPPDDERGRIEAALAEVSGVGPAKQTQLAQHFGSLAALRSASVEELADVPGISRTLAGRIQRALR